MFYNNLLIGKDNSYNSAFNTFKDNINLDSSITKDIDILNKNFQHLPYEFRDADLIMLAGAYGTGKICAYDSVGDIIDLGFSRNNAKYGFNKSYSPLEVGNNVPLLDSVYYKAYQSGYVIESSYSSLFYSNPTDLFNLGCATSIDGMAIRCVGNNTNTTTTSRLNTLNSVFPTNTIIRTFFNVGNLNKSRTMYFPLGTGSAQWTYFNFNNLTYIINANTALYEVIDVSFITSELLSFTFKIKALPSSGTRIGFNIDGLTDNTNSWWWGYLSDSEFRTPVKTTASGGSSASDAISNITLTQSAKVFIKTGKGSKLLTLPSGNFNIHDYISNDKLICLTIKYI